MFIAPFILSLFAPAFAEEPVPVVSPVAAPKTYILVAGTSEYQNAPDLPGVEGATKDCQTIGARLIEVGFTTEQVTALCGDKLTKPAVVEAVNTLAPRLVAGDTFVVVWIGHGGQDPKDETKKYWQGYDGSFVVDPAAPTNYFTTGITPTMLTKAIKSKTPAGTPIVLMTDTSDSGSYNGIPLSGPVADTFEKEVYMISPGMALGKSGALTKSFIGCLEPRMRYGVAEEHTAIEVQACMSNGLRASNIESWLSSADWDTITTLIWFPPLPPALPRPLPEQTARKPSTVKPAMRWGGVALAVIGGGGAAASYLHADGIAGQIADENGVVDPRDAAALEEYNLFKTLTYVGYGVVGLGAISFGGSLVVAPAPTGVTVSGTF